VAKATKRRRKKKPRMKRRTKTLPGEIVGEMNGFPVRRVQVGALTGADYNPRRISDTAFQGLQRSTEKFGLVQPAVWNKRTQNLVGGHQRLKTQDPDDYTDVVEVDLSEVEEKALNLALNSRHISGEFTSGLGDILAELEVEIPDLATELHLGELYLDLPPEVVSETPEPPEDPGAEDPPEDPVSERGEVYELGVSSVCPHCDHRNIHKT